MVVGIMEGDKSIYVPEDKSVEEGTFALVIQQNGQYLFKFEKAVPWGEVEWVNMKKFDHDDVPNDLHLRSAKIKQKVNNDGLEAVVLYADMIHAGMDENEMRASDAEHAESDGGVTDSKSISSSSGYRLSFSDGMEIPNDGVVHASQRENMGRAVDYLIEEYQITSQIDLPYSGGIGRATINTEPKKSNGSEMAHPYELSDGNYLRTTMGRTEKKRFLKRLAEEVGLEVSVSGEWLED